MLGPRLDCTISLQRVKMPAKSGDSTKTKASCAMFRAIDSAIVIEDAPTQVRFE